MMAAPSRVAGAIAGRERAMTRMTPSEAFVETLVNYGVTDIFGIGFTPNG